MCCTRHRLAAPCKFALIVKCSELRLYSETALAFLYASYNLCVDVEALADGNDLLCHFRTYVDFHAVSHVEHFVHLFPVCAALLLYGLEQRRHGEHVVLYHTAVIVYEMQHLGLCSTSAMYHSVYFRTKLIKTPLQCDDEFYSRLNLTKEGIKYVFHQDIYRASDNKICFKGVIDLVCLVNGKLANSPEYDEAFKEYI